RLMSTASAAAATGSFSCCSSATAVFSSMAHLGCSSNVGFVGASKDGVHLWCFFHSRRSLHQVSFDQLKRLEGLEQLCHVLGRVASQDSDFCRPLL
ncbi:unnamed protein product, partial [Closterium sp. NIES-65]